MFDPKPDAAGRDPRAVQADRNERRRTSSSPRCCRGTRRSPTSSRWSARCYHTARGGARHRPPDDADRPAVHRRRQHAARRVPSPVTCAGRKTELPPHVVLPEVMGPSGGNMPHGQDARVPRQGVRPVRAQRRPVASRISGCPTCCRPRRSARSGSSGAGRSRQTGGRQRRANSRRPRRALHGRQLPGGLPADDQPAGAGGVRPGQGAAAASATATA